MGAEGFLTKPSRSSTRPCLGWLGPSLQNPREACSSAEPDLGTLGSAFLMHLGDTRVLYLKYQDQSCRKVVQRQTGVLINEHCQGPLSYLQREKLWLFMGS